MKIVSVDLHVDYPDMHRHWDSQSERYGGGDSLLTALQAGWEMNTVCWSEEYWHAGTRPVMIYHFELNRAAEKLHMPVVSNPFIQRLLDTLALEVKPIEQRTAADV
jgi:hypothetical protein